MKSKASPHESLFEDKLKPFGQVADLAAIDVALSDARNGFHHVEAILGKLSRTGTSDGAPWLDQVMNLKVELSHIARHLTEVDEDLQSLILALQDHASPSGTDK